MIYRKVPPQPVRMLLRVVAAAGASAMAGAVACSSSGDVQGLAANPADGGHHDTGAIDTGTSSSSGSSSGGFMGFTDGGGGIMGSLDGEVSDVLNGTVANPEGGPCEDGGCGLVSNPDAAADVVTGVVVHPDGGGD